jgi:hypothetical protein
MEELRKKKAKLAAKKPPLHSQARSLAEDLVNPLVKHTWAPYQIPDTSVVPPQDLDPTVVHWKRIKMVENAGVLIAPKVDASDKQIFANNNYRTNAENLELFLENKGASQVAKDIFRPAKFGDFSNKLENMVYMASENRAAVIPDYAMSYIIDSDFQLERKRQIEEANKKKVRAENRKIVDEQEYKKKLMEIKSRNHQH